MSDEPDNTLPGLHDQPTQSVPPVPSAVPPPAPPPTYGQAGSALPPPPAPAAQIPAAQIPAAQIPATEVGGGAPSISPRSSSSNAGLIAAVIVLSLIVVAGMVGGAFLLGSGRSDSTDATESTQSSTTTSVTTTAAPASTVDTTVPPAPEPTPPPTAPPPSAVGNVVNQPPGLLCKDLAAKGYGYSAAVDYWTHNGQPERMDVDKDGIPCETVYSRDSVIGYWGTLGRTVSVDEQTSIYDLRPGLRCADLQAGGADTRAALQYYVYWGRPPLMDADGNGVPCETVYSDAATIWFNEF